MSALIPGVQKKEKSREKEKRIKHHHLENLDERFTGILFNILATFLYVWYYVLFKLQRKKHKY